MGTDEPPPYAAIGNRNLDNILLTTTDDTPGFEVTAVHGVVYGTTVRERKVRKLAVTGRGLRDGEHMAFTNYIVEFWKIAASRLIEAVKEVGDNAASGMKFDIEFVPQQVCEAQITCYATAVSIVPIIRRT